MNVIKNSVFICFCCIFFSCQIVGASTSFPIQPIIHLNAIPFHLNEVILLDSRFKHAQELDEKWLLSLKPDRFLNRFEKNAGFIPKDSVYGGWESLGVGGQSMGHYLSACAMMYQSTGDVRFKDRTDYITAELAKCQFARGTGYVGSIIGEDSIWAQVSRGDIRSTGFDLNGGWVPWYVMHKIWAGLIDVYTYTHNEQAKTVVIKLSDWAYNQFHNLTEKQWQKILACEHGGMLESFVNVYAITGNNKYLEMSKWFNHNKLFKPLLAQKDSLAGLHANTQIPQIVGLARRFEFTNDIDDKMISHFFWKTVTSNHTYSIGGNSDGEHFGEPGILSTRLSDRTTETCNTYNMLKLTKLLFTETAEVQYADFYEKALYNHILSSQNPETGMVTYYVPLVAGCKRVYSTPFESFTCCVGTGFENHARYGEAIYFKSTDKGVYVNLFIPSKLFWNERNVTITQQNEYPEKGNLTFIVNTKKNQYFPFYLRFPAWAKEGASLLINGKSIVFDEKPGSFIKLERNWKNNDRIEFRLNMPLYLDPMPDNSNRAAIKYGPVVLAGKLGNGLLKPTDIPVLVTENRPIKEWLMVSSIDSCTFRTQKVGLPSDITLAPFYSIYNEQYIVYFDLFSRASWKEKEAGYKAYKAEQDKQKLQTVDYIQLGEMQPERDHNLTGNSTDVGEFMGRKFRLSWNNGWYSFNMNVKPELAMQLVCTYHSNDGDSNAFDILVDNQIIANVVMTADKTDHFYDLKFDIPKELIQGKSKVTVLFKSHENKMVGRLFGCRIINK